MSALDRVLADPASLDAWRFLREHPTPEYAKLRARAAELVRQHGTAWAGKIADLVDKYRFHRGLVAEVTISLDRFVEHADELCRLAPLQHLNLRGPATRFRELVAHPRFAQIVSFEVAGQASTVGDAEAIALAQSPRASRLRWIALSRNAIGRPGVEALVASPHLAKVVFLALDGNPFDPSPAVWNDGGVVSVEPGPHAAELQRSYGPRPWLNPSHDLAESWPPSRDMFAAE